MIGGKLKFTDQQFATSRSLPVVGYRGLFATGGGD